MKRHISLLGCILLLVIAANATPPDIRALLPKNNEVKGWVRDGKPRVFSHDELWEYINGGADVYLDYGFRKVAAVDMKNGSRTITVDIYDMNKLEGAFGMYARERSPGYKFIKIGAEGYREGVALNFYQSRYYVKLTAFTDDAPTRKVLTRLANVVSKNIGSGKKPPALLSLFPPRGKKKHTETYEAKRFLGSTALRSSFTAKYNRKGAKFTAFVCRTKSSARARARLNIFRPKLSDRGSLDKLVQNLGDQALTGRVKSGDVVLVRKGAYILGIVPAPGSKVTTAFMKSFLARIGK